MNFSLQTIDTPALLIDSVKMHENLDFVQKLATNKILNLRPHFKTHKSIELAKLQISKGAIGMACSKTEEALCLADAGIKDIQIANVLTGEHKYNRLVEIHNMVDHLTFGVDCLEHIEEADNVARANDIYFNVQIEVNYGLNRNGVSTKDQLLLLANAILEKDNLNFAGIYTHAGSVYSAQSPEEISEISKESIRLMSHFVKSLKEEGFKCPSAGIGSTPELKHIKKTEHLTELRPGNYIFNDNMQIALGSCTEDEVALYVVATVIGVHKDRVVIDAGSKALGLDKGAHGTNMLEGYGKILDRDSVISRVSEEHGIIDNPQEEFNVGEKLLIIPNHACAVVNLFDRYLLLEEESVSEIKIDARGMSR